MTSAFHIGNHGNIGSHLYLDALNAAVVAGDNKTRDTLMRDTTTALIQWQLRGDASALLRRELALFPQWCVGVECGATWTSDEQAEWQIACDLLVDNALAHPPWPCIGTTCRAT